ncbi:hypothetical protein [Burkholderia sp. Ac-20345]|nr:hypothetical protein [Burkholderia sp. Ac-20345]
MKWGFCGLRFTRTKPDWTGGHHAIRNLSGASSPVASGSALQR